ncbi:site-specific DNA-methyltransferase [Shinella sp.]|uniref:DNA-methyltransferase n=1 Tax=Shinella sp. TaxID=1870904 RepID=UPI00258E9CC5|nr:site-specific DNA-methyltransferase [Shinella sp.]MCW5706913.1 site-specific DNA-methyltransferase [Shinella sp.]
MTAAARTVWLDQTHVGDCRDLLRQMADDGVQVQMCVTSPPYFRLRSYLLPDHPDKALEIGTEATPAEFVASLVDVFRQLRCILADDGTLWIVIGDTYAARRTWQAPSTRGGPKHAAAQAAVGGMQLGDGLKPKDLIGLPWMLAFALRGDGWYLRQSIIWAKPNPMPESVRDRCTRSHEYLFLFAKSSHYFFDHEAIREPSLDPRGPGNLCPVRQPPGENASGPNGNLRGRLHQIGARETRNRRDVWTISNRPFHGAHFAVFPDELVTPCILAGSRAGDAVLDPFMGAGTTAAAAERLGRRFIGCELNGSFLDLHRQRREPAGRSPVNSTEKQS